MKKLALVLLAVAAAAACTPDEEKVRKVVERALEECKKAEGEFAAVEVVGGTDEILKDTCSEPITDLSLKDEFHGAAKVGPYTYLVGIDSETGVWVLTQVDWETLSDARRHLAGENPPQDARERGEAALAKAQEEMPGSPWIRIERFENLLAMRVRERGKAPDPTALGAEAQKVLDESVAWAKQNDHPALAAELQAMVVDYYRDYASKLEMALGNIGSGDEHLEALINQARKDGNKEDEEAYTKTLEESRAGRDAEIATVNERIATSKKFACEYAKKLSPAGLEGEIRDRVMALQEGTDCSAPAAGQDSEAAPADGE